MEKKIEKTGRFEKISLCLGRKIEKERCSR